MEDKSERSVEGGMGMEGGRGVKAL